jgi:hypothetical protein
MSRLIKALSSTPGRVARVGIGLGIALGGTALFGTAAACPFVFVGVVPIYLGLRGRCLLASTRGWQLKQAASRS